MALILAVLGGTHTAGATNSNDAPPPAILLSPKVEAKLKDFIDKAKVERGQVWDARMKTEIQTITKITGLGDAGGKALEGPATQAAQAGIDDWAAKMSDSVRKEFERIPEEQAVMMLDQRMAQVTSIAQWPGEGPQPFERKEWIDAVHQTLTPEQMAAWDKAQADRKDAIEKEIGDLLKRGADNIREQQKQGILSQCKEIEVAVGLPQDRASKLEDLAKSVIDETTEKWRKRVESMLLAMEDDQRHQFTQNGNVYIGTEEDEAPAHQAAWKDGIAQILTPDEMTRLQAGRDASKAKRVHAMGGIMLTLFDEKIAFTEPQRQRLRPITDRLAKDLPDLDPGDGNSYYSYAPTVFFAAAAKATDAELRPILDEIQLKRWRHLGSTGNDAPEAATDDKSKPDENAEPEDVEKIISAFLYDKAENERKRMEDTNVIKAEDAARVAGLDGEAAAQLQAAARGATEEYLVGWRAMIEQQIRSQLQDVTPQNAKQRLAGIQDFFFQRVFFGFGQTNRASLWDDAVKVALTAPQQDLWKKDQDARTAFRDQAITDLAMADFDRRFQLTPEQFAKLGPIIAQLIHDNSEDIGRVFSPFNPVPWFLEGAYLLMPFAGVPDADLKSILSKDQIDRWHGSPECANSTNLWQNIEQMHKQRARVK